MCPLISNLIVVGVLVGMGGQAETPARVRVHVSGWPPELFQGRLLFSGDGGELSSCSGGEGNKGGTALVEVDSTSYVCLREGLPLPRVLRIVHWDCKCHGLLAKKLKPNGKLRQILDAAVGNHEGVTRTQERTRAPAL